MTASPLFSGITSSKAAALEFFYVQFAQVLSTIGSVVEALDLVRGQLRNQAVTSAVDDLRRMVASGMSLADAMRLRRDVFEEDHIRLVEAGENGGNLPDALGRVASRVEHGRIMRREWWSALSYPALLLHGVAFILPISSLIDGGSAYLGRVFVNLAVLYGIVVAAYMIWRRTKGRADLTRIPLIGRAFHTLRAGALCWSLGSLYEAGVTLVAAVKGSVPTDLARDPLVARALHLLNKGEGEGFAGFVATSTLFPADTVRVVRIAQESGNLGDALLNEGSRLEDLGIRRIRATLRFTGRLIYFLAAASMGIAIIRFYASYYGQIGSF